MILNAQGSEYTQLMAGAHAIKEQTLGNRIDLCSIIAPLGFPVEPDVYCRKAMSSCWPEEGMGLKHLKRLK